MSTTTVDGKSGSGLAVPLDAPVEMLPPVETPIKGYWKSVLANEAFLWTRSALWQIEMVFMTDCLGTLPKTDIFGDHVANQLAKHIKDHRLEDAELTEDVREEVGRRRVGDCGWLDRRSQLHLYRSGLHFPGGTKDFGVDALRSAAGTRAVSHRRNQLRAFAPTGVLSDLSQRGFVGPVQLVRRSLHQTRTAGHTTD